MPKIKLPSRYLNKSTIPGNKSDLKNWDRTAQYAFTPQNHSTEGDLHDANAYCEYLEDRLILTEFDLPPKFATDEQT